MDCSSCYTFRPQKTDHATLFFVHTDSGAAILIVLQRKDKLCDDAETFHKQRQRCYLLECSRRKQYRQPIKKYNTCADTYLPISCVGNENCIHSLDIWRKESFN